MEDNAGGIKKENIAKIFDPYFTTKSNTGGSGLGLYIAKIIIEHNMYGTLTVANTKEGAKFTISLPQG
jgi:signal transduction histidine kinase